MNATPSVTIVSTADSVAASIPAQWALSHCAAVLAQRGVTAAHAGDIPAADASSLAVLAGSPADGRVRRALTSAGVDPPSEPESFALVPSSLDGTRALVACGADPLGLVYALTELADRFACAKDPLDGLRLDRPVTGRPANRIRSIARYFCSDVEDKTWFHDRGFWDRYLTMLATQRFNRFSLSFGLGYNFPRDVYDTTFYFTYPFLLEVPGYNVRVPGLPDEERDRNFASLKHIAAETGRRGLQFQLALWTHAYEWVDSPNANYTIEGLDAETHAPYCRDALRLILEACPEITGVTFRIHGESGIPEGSYDFWSTVFEGVVAVGRPVEIDMHAKGLDAKTIDLALGTGLPVVISPKYWAEHQALPMHQAAIRAQEAPRAGKEGDFMAFSGGARRFLRYSYGDLLKEDRRYGILYRIWAGTQRVLTWGDPAFAAGYGRCASYCGSDGMELCEPLTFKGRMGTGSPGDRAGYIDAALAPGLDDWTKFEPTYRQIGRCLYDPDGDPDGWRRAFGRDLGPAAAPMERALSSASRVLPLVTIAHHTSASNNQFWPEMYTNQPITTDQGHPYRDTPSPKDFGHVSPLDPATFLSIEEHADLVVGGGSDARYTPVEVAGWLEEFARDAETALAEARAAASDPGATPFRRLAVDITIQAGLGHFFADKLRAGVAFALWSRRRDEALIRRALSVYRRAREAWAALSEAASVYADDQGYGQGPHRRGHWRDRLSAIDADIDALAALLEGEEADVPPVSLGERPRPSVDARHVSPDGFVPGRPLRLTLNVDPGDARSLTAVRLRYRHVNQAEPYELADTVGSNGDFTAEIPSAYTESPYPLQYGFEIEDSDGNAAFWPGLARDLSNQPYYVLRRRP